MAYKRYLTVLALLVILLIALSACAQSDSNSNNITISNRTAESIQTEVCFSTYDSSSYVGMNYLEVETLFNDAGFEEITLAPIDDIDSNSSIPDGTVETVTINGLSEFTEKNEFDKSDEVIITYHNIPKIEIPLTSTKASTIQYIDVAKLFFDAGFKYIETNEVYDLPPASAYRTEIRANGQRIGDQTVLPFDSTIDITGHYPMSEYTVNINIDFNSNLVFNKYDVDVSLDNNKLGSLSHGEDGSYTVSLPVGTYNLVICNSENNEIKGTIELRIESDTDASYSITCEKENIRVKELNVSTVLQGDNVLMTYSPWHFIGNDYQTVKEELIELGFTNISIKSTTDSYWATNKINSVVGIEINGSQDFKHGDLFNKSIPITLLYHVAGFSFDQTSITVTENDVFNVPYTVITEDNLDSIEITIGDPSIVKKNEDGTYTALIPGKTSITASGEGRTYSTCTINVNERIIPIEKLVFESEVAEISVGSIFVPQYTIVPDNANYTDMRIELSNDCLENINDREFYSSETGDSEITFYQDERLIGSVTVHSELIEIEEIVVEDFAEELFIGDSLSLPFTLIPDNATNKGIQVESSDSNVAEVSFNERGESVVKIKGISIGQSTITLTAPNGITYSHDISVNEIPPSDISIIDYINDQRIEVGSHILMSLRWYPLKTTDKAVTWESSDTGVIQVDDEGNAEAVGVGTAVITVKHKSGLTATKTIVVEPTLVTKVDVSLDMDESRKLYIGDQVNVLATIYPENATDQTLLFTSKNEGIAKVSDRGVITAVGVGTTDITVSTHDGISKSISVTITPAPQKFRITYSSYLISSNHVGSNWSRSFYVDHEDFYSGSTLVLDPDSSFVVSYVIEENDKYPDTGSYYKKFDYSEDLCMNGYSETTTILVEENSGRYSGYTAQWSVTINITPIK